MRPAYCCRTVLHEAPQGVVVASVIVDRLHSLQLYGSSPSDCLSYRTCIYSPYGHLSYGHLNIFSDTKPEVVHFIFVFPSVLSY